MAHQVNKGISFLGPAVTAGLSGTWNSNCTEFTFIPRETYAFEFRLLYAADNMRMFQPNKDHIAVGLRAKADASLISGTHDFMIYPPQVSDASAPTMLRYGEFSVLDTVKACFAITFAFYSPVANTGTLTFQNFKVIVKRMRRIILKAAIIRQILPRSRCKAFQLDLDVKRRGETGRVTMVIPTANNGVAATRLRSHHQPMTEVTVCRANKKGYSLITVLLFMLVAVIAATVFINGSVL
jgi:hypothetical protein